MDRLATTTTAAAKRLFTYDNNGYTATRTDWNGNLTTFVNDAHGQPLTIVEAAGTSQARATTYLYLSNRHLPSKIVKFGLTKDFVYDGSGNTLAVTLTDTTTTTIPYSTNGQKRTFNFTWGSYGLLASAQGPRTDVNATTTFIHATDGALIGIKDAAGHMTSITAHTGGGLPETIVDPNGVTTTLAYDKRLNLKSKSITTSAGVLTTIYGHDAANNLTLVQLPDGSEQIALYDTAHRRIGIKVGLNNSITFTLDALGDVTLIETRDAAQVLTRTHSAVFDALGRKLSDVSGNGQATTYGYDNNGNLLIITPPAPSGAKTFGYDQLNRRTFRKDPSPGGTTIVIYDPDDRPIAVQDAGGSPTGYVFSGFGDLKQLASPDAGTTTFYVDGAGNRIQTVKPGLLIQNDTFDVLDRLLTTTLPADPSLNVKRVYDEPNHGFAIGQVTTVTDQVGTLSVSYEERGLAVQEVRTVPGGGILTMTTAYDQAGRVAGFGYPSGTIVSYGRDSAGHVTSVLAGAPGSKAPMPVVSGITYEPFGPEIALIFGNGIKAAYTYDHNYLPTNRVETGAAAVQRLGYTYLPNESVSSITDGVDPRNSQSFGYTPLDQISTAVSGAGGYGTQSYAWNPGGNITSHHDNQSTTTAFFNPASNRIKLVQFKSPYFFSWNPAGDPTNLSTDGSRLLITYSQANRMSTTQSMLTTSYGYDFIGNRVMKSFAGEYPTLYQYSHASGQLLSENNLHGGPAADYIYLNSRPIGEIDPASGKMYFTHTDRLGTPQKLTDSNQKVVWSALYTPFGATGAMVTNGIVQTLRLPGQQADGESGLYHNGFRDYSPSLGRYIETDPIGLAGGLNTYAYAKGNPLNRIDPGGTTDYFGIPANIATPDMNRFPLGVGPFDRKLPTLTLSDQHLITKTADILDEASFITENAAVFNLTFENAPAAAVFGGVSLCTAGAALALDPTVDRAVKTGVGFLVDRYWRDGTSAVADDLDRYLFEESSPNEDSSSLANKANKRQ